MKSLAAPSNMPSFSRELKRVISTSTLTLVLAITVITRITKLLPITASPKLFSEMIDAFRKRVCESAILVVTAKPKTERCKSEVSLTKTP